VQLARRAVRSRRRDARTVDGGGLASVRPRNRPPNHRPLSGAAAERHHEIRAHVQHQSHVSPAVAAQDRLGLPWTLHLESGPGDSDDRKLPNGTDLAPHAALSVHRQRPPAGRLRRRLAWHPGCFAGLRLTATAAKRQWEKKMTAADCLIETIHDWGVDVVFGLPGDGINGIM